MPKRLRLVKVAVQPYFVVEEDGEIVGECQPDPVTIGAKDWSGFASGAFLEAVASLESQVNGDRPEQPS